MSSELRNRWEHAGGKLPDDWQIVPFESLFRDAKSIAVGVMYPGPDTIGGTPLIKVGDIKDGAITTRPDYCISAETNLEHKRTQLDGNELLITLVGNPGECVVVKTFMKGWNPARAIAVVRLKDLNLRTYVKSVLESAAGKHLIDAVLNTTVQKTLNLKDVRQLPIPLPKISTIQAISLFSEALTDRITLLRETNTTLEAIAQALFKSWFVDFDPVHAKQQGRKPEGMDANTAALFPDSFEESELGLVPMGWRVTKSGTAIDIRDGTHESPKEADSGYPFITTRHISSGKITFENSYLISEDDYINFSRRSKVDRLDILISMIGTVGIPVIVLKNKTEFAVKNIGILKTSFEKKLSHFMYLLLKSTVIQQQIESRLAGTTQKYLSLSALRDIKFIMSNDLILEHFSQIVTTLFDRISQNDDAIQTLANLRDTLLPRLISGQLRLPDSTPA